MHAGEIKVKIGRLVKNESYQGPDLTETMKDQIRNWFAKDKEEQGKFPEYPSDEEGGSNLIFNPDAVIHDSDGETTRRDEKGKKEEKKEGEEEEATTKVSVFRRMAEAASNWEEEVLWKPTKANS